MQGAQVKRSAGNRRRSPILWLTLLAALVPAARALADNEPIEWLLSLIFFENTSAWKDTQDFFCRHIALTADGDYCNASLTILDPAQCKVQIVREIRATYGEGKGREFMYSRNTYTLINVDLDRSKPEAVPEKRAGQINFEGIGEVIRREGYQYSFDLDADGSYAACRINGQPQKITEAECIRAGTNAPTVSNKMTLMFGQIFYPDAIRAIRKLQTEHCPSRAEKT
jgi:hypothetical protein